MSKEISLKEQAFPEISNLELNNSFNQLVAIMPEHSQMLDGIKESLPEIQRSTSLFFKTQSQMMDNMLTVSHNTPLRNLRQILAEMNASREAIKEAIFKLKKKEIETRQKQRQSDNSKDDLEIEMLTVEILEIQANADSTRGYISGAIRKLANYTEQYNSITQKFGVSDFNEADFEREEEAYHIKKAFEQGLCAARAHGGVIDEGNGIYFVQIGINGAHAQFYVTQFLRAEQSLLSEGKAPTHKAYLDFLDDMVNVFTGSAQVYAEAKGMNTMTNTALLQKGDDRLLLAKKE